MGKLAWDARTNATTPTGATTEFPAEYYEQIKDVVNGNDDAANADSIAFGAAIPFSNMYGLMAAKTIDQAYVFTKNVTDQITFGACQLQLTANGNAAHVPDFSAFKKTDNGVDWDNTLDVLNIIYIWYDGITHRYLISRSEVGPVFISSVMAASNELITVTVDKGIYGSGNGTGPVLLNDFNYVFNLNGGTLTTWLATSITKVGGAALVGGETVFEIHATATGTADGQETIGISPSGQKTVFDSNGNAMDFGESAVASVNNSEGIFKIQMDTANTTVTGLGISQADDVWNGNNYVQAVDADRPALVTEDDLEWADFDGVTEHLKSNFVSQSYFRNSFSIAMRIKPADGQPASSSIIVGTQDAAPSVNSFAINLQTTGKFRCYYETNDVQALADSAASVFADGAQSTYKVIIITVEQSGFIKMFQNVAANTAVEIAKDGTNDGDMTGVTMSLYTNANDPYLGANNYFGGVSAEYDGLLGDVRFYQKILSQSEMNAIVTEMGK